MSERKLTRAEELVKELAEVREREAQFEGWRWMAGTTMYKNFVMTREVTTTSVLGFKGESRDDYFIEVPHAVAREFHAFLAMKRDSAYRRGQEIERELEAMSNE